MKFKLDPPRQKLRILNLAKLAKLGREVPVESGSQMASFKSIVAALDANEQTPEIYAQFRDRIVQLGRDFEVARERFELDRRQDVEDSLRRLLGTDTLRVLLFTKEGSLATPGSTQTCQKPHYHCKCFKKRLSMRLRLEGGLLFQCSWRQRASQLDPGSNQTVYLPEDSDETWSIEAKFLDDNEFDEETLKGEIRQALEKYKRPMEINR